MVFTVPPPLPTTVCGHALSDTYVEARLGFYICFKLANVMRMQCSIVAFARGKTALMVASSQANIEAMRVLLAAGAGDLWYKHSTKRQRITQASYSKYSKTMSLPLARVQGEWV